MTSIPTNVLRWARDEQELNQAALAQRLKISPSVLSRLEREETTDAPMAWRYLDAVGSAPAKEIRTFYERPWIISDRPGFLHPDREMLGELEAGLQRLEVFEKADDFDIILSRPVNTLRSRLLSTAQFLNRLDHSIAWIGEIGIGKTTALSRATDLTLPSKEGPRSIFPTGSGRVTICEVIVKVAPAFGLVVDCLSSDAVRALVTDLITGLVKRETGVSTEMDRALRTMADLGRDPVMVEGRRRFIDPIRTMLDAGDSSDEIINRFMSRLNLDSRTQNKIILSQDKERGLEWIADNVSRINFGQHPDFGVPSRITVLLPSKTLRKSSFDLSVIDTKGIEGTTQRPDLRAQIDDPRALAVLCTRFNDAPGEKPMALLKEVLETRSDAIERGRICILVLSREGEALAVHGDDGLTPETVEDGYTIREDHIADALSREGLPSVPVFFYNAVRDGGQAIWPDLNARIQTMRARHHDRARRLLAGAEALITDADAARSVEARAEIASTVSRWITRNGSLPMSTRSVHENLVDQARGSHASSIAAAMFRRGRWDNFPVHHMLGVGVRADAAVRTGELFVRIDEMLADLEHRFGYLADVRQTLVELRDEASEWEQEFLGQALVLGRNAFTAAMDDDAELWRRCSIRWGEGSGYREDIADELRAWFERVELDDARRWIDSGLNQAWRELVLDRLGAAAVEPAEADEEIVAA